MNKYILTSETKNIDFTVLHRIQALKDFGNVKAGDLGGWIERESNLSQEGLCWVYGNTKVYGNAIISGDVFIAGDYWISGCVHIYGKSWIYVNASICENIKK